MSTHECFLFEVTLEIKEKSETANTYDLVPRQKGIFKLRSNVEKKVVVSVQQISQNSCNLGTIHVLRKHFLAQNFQIFHKKGFFVKTKEFPFQHYILTKFSCKAF